MTEKPKPKSRGELEKELAAARDELASYREVHRNVRDQLDAAVKREKETRAQFDDLKQRLVIAESANQQMRGYIARVQEDDVVREDLVTVGDPAGEQRLVPKRKSTNFCEPYPYAIDNRASHGSVGLYRDHEQTKPLKHWVTY